MLDLPLTEQNEVKIIKHVSTGEKIFAGVFSYFFHPLLIPVYVIVFLAYIHPYAFAGFSQLERKQSVVIVVLNIVFFPLLSVLLLKAVGFIDSVFLRTKKDRIIPYMACGIFFFWAYTVFKEQTHYPLLLTSFIFGIFLASSAGLMANIYYKISMHAIGMGGWLGFFIIIAMNDNVHMSWPLSLVILLTGAVCTSRFLISDHSHKDIYTGLIAGMLTQFAAALFVL